MEVQLAHYVIFCFSPWNLHLCFAVSLWICRMPDGLYTGNLEFSGYILIIWILRCICNCKNRGFTDKHAYFSFIYCKIIPSKHLPYTEKAWALKARCNVLIPLIFLISQLCYGINRRYSYPVYQMSQMSATPFLPVHGRGFTSDNLTLILTGSLWCSSRALQQLQNNSSAASNIRT